MACALPRSIIITAFQSSYVRCVLNPEAFGTGWPPAVQRSRFATIMLAIGSRHSHGASTDDARSPRHSTFTARVAIIVFPLSVREIHGGL